MNELRRILYSQIEWEKAAVDTKLHNLGEEFRVGSRRLFDGFRCELHMINGLGYVTMEGYSPHVKDDEEAFVLDKSGLFLRKGRNIPEETQGLMVTRSIYDDSLPIRNCTLTIDGEELSFSGKMWHGNPDLPEESEDFIETWSTSLKGRELQKLPFFVLPDDDLLHALNFRFDEVREGSIPAEWE